MPMRWNGKMTRLKNVILVLFDRTMSAVRWTKQKRNVGIQFSLINNWSSNSIVKIDENWINANGLPHALFALFGDLMSKWRNLNNSFKYKWKFELKWVQNTNSKIGAQIRMSDPRICKQIKSMNNLKLKDCKLMTHRKNLKHRFKHSKQFLIK